MSNLRDLVDDPKGLLARLRPSAPEPAQLRQAVAAIEGQTMHVDQETIAVLQARVVDTVRCDGASALSRRDLREGCKLFLLPPGAPGRQDDIRRDLVAEVRRLERRAAFFALIDSYVDAFDPDDEAVGATAEQLALAASAWPWRPGDHWPADIAALDLFDPQASPVRLAGMVLQSDHAPLDALGSVGLATAGRRKGGLVSAAFERACALVAKLKGREAERCQGHLIDWARDEDGSFAYPRSWPGFVEACLSPWTESEPDDGHKTRLLDVLEGFGGGDPRIKPERWRSVIERFPDAYGVLLRWLTRASVLQFLEIVDRSLRDPDAKRMWSYRRAFWTSYLMGTGGGPRIDAAWVAFGDDGARLARQTARETGDRSFAMFGLQQDRSPQHAALIVRIGELTIADWSHNARYNVWRRGDQHHPELFKRSYAVGELYSAPLQGTHSSPATYSWQRKLAELIERKAFWAEKPDWRPRRV